MVTSTNFPIAFHPIYLFIFNNVPFVRFQISLMAFSKYYLIQKFNLFISKHIILNGSGTFWN